MTLTRLLEIDRALLTLDESRGLALAELLWNRAGRPAETGALCRALENILGACQSEGLRYPPILLRRKKELERGAWAPQAADEAEPKRLRESLPVLFAAAPARSPILAGFPGGCANASSASIAKAAMPG